MAEPKAKRSLHNIKFAHEGAHVALVSKEQGGPANGKNFALIMKAANYSPEYITKMQGVRVTMDMPDFLEKFFSMWEGDAELLASLLGYVDDDDAAEGETPDPVTQKDYIAQYVADNLASFEIMKAAHTAASPELVTSVLDEKQYLRLLKDQAFVEKAFRKGERLEKKLKKTAEEPSEATLTNNTETKVSENTNTESVQKSLEDTKVLLEKANSELTALKKAADDAVIKAKTDKVEALVKDASQKEILVKAALALSTDEDFNAFVASIEALNKQVETSVLFKETGAAPVCEDKDTKTNTGVAAVLKAKYAAK